MAGVFQSQADTVANVQRGLAERRDFDLRNEAARRRREQNAERMRLLGQLIQFGAPVAGGLIGAGVGAAAGGPAGALTGAATGAGIGGAVGGAGSSLLDTVATQGMSQDESRDAESQALFQALALLAGSRR